MDTETLLAMLASLLDPPIPDQAMLLDALAECDGDVEKAAKALRQRETIQPASVNGRKRKRGAGLDQWFGGSPTKASSSKRSSKPPSTGHINSTTKADHSAPVSSSKRHIFDNRGVSPERLPVGSSSTEGSVVTSDMVETSLPAHDASPSKKRSVTNDEFLSLFRPPNSKEAPKKPALLPPLTLGTPSLVKEHTPCTYHPSILPPELACRLFYAMLDLSGDWQRNKWWLFDRVVESPHRTSFFVRRREKASENEHADMQEAAQYWYNGRETGPPKSFPPAMEEACEIIERVVNAEMHKRKRYPLEWAGEVEDAEKGTAGHVLWRANVAAANCYEGAKDSVGPHSDQLTYLGPYPTIASLSLGTSRIFRLREVIPLDERDERSARTYSIPLAHNSLLIMHASTQERFKHSIPPQNSLDLFHPPFPPPSDLRTGFDNRPGFRATTRGEASNARINVTFRFYRPDFRAQTTPRCKCGVPCILRPDMKNRYTAPPPGKSDAAVFGDASGAGAHQDASDAGRDLVTKYWWTCYAGAQNEGKGCGLWKVMDVKAEGRGPFVGPLEGRCDDAGTCAALHST
ncbi:hypothetical protein DAEQUDRAFT_728231 [Daedalea quercina L-15889]|uniref:Fe2OG dioxygenase domain-containing protein n=1 Tax=Daedalea quercina L-15889 TaxID=1314783 RepID=A0A165PGF6_9APHY|nr:hypothetical protein DAEQUDRAFT_728231 [Daedalea quercina L-15889]